MTTPQSVPGASGAALPPQNLAANAAVAFDVDLSGALRGLLQVACVFPGQAPSGEPTLQVDVLRRIGSPITVDTDPVTDLSFVVYGAQSATTAASRELPTGRYHVIVTNKDAAATVVASATLDVVTGFA